MQVSDSQAGWRLESDLLWLQIARLPQPGPDTDDLLQADHVLRLSRPHHPLPLPLLHLLLPHLQLGGVGGGRVQPPGGQSLLLLSPRHLRPAGGADPPSPSLRGTFPS